MNDVYPSMNRVVRRQLFETQFGFHIGSRQMFLNDLRAAIEAGRPYAIGRLGISEKHWMYYPRLLAENASQTKIKVFEKLLIYHGLSQVGIFPAQPSFYLRYNDFFVARLKKMDWLGLVLEPVLDPKVVEFYNLENNLIYYLDLNPDKSIPENPSNCYLPFLRDKKVLLICPFGEFLATRATKEIFEGVWSKTGKKWFYPARVEGLEFPYGFDIETQQQYGTAVALYEHITGEIAKRDFDIAIIAAGGLAVPIALFVKSLGKIGFDLGGELQFLFGVKGKRWEDDERWRKNFFTEWWVQVPEKYRPKQKGVAGDGAFWSSDSDRSA